jgi:TetR/AcrR family transcriptional repressor of nem operon
LPLLEDAGVRPRERLQRYFAGMAANMAKRGYSGGCLIGNLGAELADQSELVRDRVTAVFSGWTGAVEACIRDGQRKGEIPADWDAAVLASFLINAWEGAVLRTKVEKNGAAFEEFDQIVFGKLLQLEE